MKKLFITLIIGWALLVVPGMMTQSFAKNTVSKAGVVVQKVDINKASAVELTTLKGIGQKKAEAIVTFRKQNGQFKKAEDIMLVKGIGEKLYEKIKNRIKVSK